MTETIKLSDLTPHPDNPRQGDIGAIATSIQENGWYGTIVAQKSTGHVLAGNHRLQAAQQLGMTELPVYWVDVDDTTARKILLADNRTNDIANYDDEALAEILKELASTDDLLGTGYDGDDLDTLLGDLEWDEEESDDPMEPQITVPENPVTKRGDIIQLGNHRLMCGDCRESDDVSSLMDGETIHMAFTSPPYAEQRVYDESSGFKPIHPDEYVEWFDAVQSNVRTHFADDGSWFVNIKASVTPNGDATELYVLDLVLAHARLWGWNLATEFCWERSGMPKLVTRRFKNQFEPVYQFALGRWKFNPDDVRHESDSVPTAGGPGVGATSWANAQGTKTPLFGGHYTNSPVKRKGGTSEFMADVQGTNTAPGEYIGPGLAYPGNRLPTFTGSHTAVGHTAAFPVGLPEWFIKAYTDDGDNVYDPFIGSGSTMLAAENQDRKCFGMEISPAYCDVIVTRWETVTGKTAQRP